MSIIQVDNLTKEYVLNSGPMVTTFRDLVLKSIRPSAWKGQHGKRLLALDDVSFEVEEGDVLGIVGHNGAGKSTLLKILSRIVLPSSGEAILRGRTGSLLEIGTGFHRELSGRENIFLNGAILGMKRSEISRRFDEIVEFSELEDFLDTPIKHYSSGMYTRLAFSIAAHLEPEILIVDEVLAVGDLAFQRKCMKKMQDVNRVGRTILFVSHNMQAISRICSRGLLIEHGKLVADGPADDIVASYLASMLETSNQKTWGDPDTAPGSDVVKLRSVRLKRSDGTVSTSFDIRKPVMIEITYDVLKDGAAFMPGFELFNEEGICLFVSNDLDPEFRGRPRDIGTYVSIAEIPGNFLAEGNFFVSVSATSFEPHFVHFYERDTAAFNVTDSLDGDSARGDLAGNMHGVIRPVLEWTTSRTEK